MYDVTMPQPSNVDHNRPQKAPHGAFTQQLKMRFKMRMGNVRGNPKASEGWRVLRRRYEGEPGCSVAWIEVLDRGIKKTLCFNGNTYFELEKLSTITTLTI